MASDTHLSGILEPLQRLVTTDMNDSIGLYLNEIGKVSLLTAEEER